MSVINENQQNMLVKLAKKPNTENILWVKADRFSKQLERDKMKIEKLIKKLDERIGQLPPLPQVSIITLTDGPEGLQ